MRFAAYTRVMQEIEAADVKTKSEGDKLLQPYEKVNLKFAFAAARLHTDRAVAVFADKAIPTYQRHAGRRQDDQIPYTAGYHFR